MRPFNKARGESGQSPTGPNQIGPGRPNGAGTGNINFDLQPAADNILGQHAQIRQGLLNQALSPLEEGQLTLNPYGFCPMAAVFGFAHIGGDVTVTVTPKDQSELAVTHIYKAAELLPGQGNLINVLGFLARPGSTTNCEVVITNAQQEFRTVVEIGPLPQTDEEAGFGDFASQGFPIIAANQPASAQLLGNNLYMVPCSEQRTNIMFDREGNIRWYTDTDGNGYNLPCYNTLRLSDGRFLGDDDHLFYNQPDSATARELSDAGNKEFWFFDMAGRVDRILMSEERAHHCFLEFPDPEDGNRLKLIYPSEYKQARDPNSGPPTTVNKGASSEDVIAIADLETGEEEVYYDLRQIMNIYREPRPTDTSIAGVFDWCHTNQVAISPEHDLIVASCRHQGVIGLRASTGELLFILANHEDWDADNPEVSFQQPWSDYLVTPLKADDSPYDLNDAADSLACDREFWPWGQHNVSLGTITDGSNFQIWLFNNGNYKSRDDQLALLPHENTSACVCYEIRLGDPGTTASTAKIVQKYEDVTSRGYSSYVGTATPYQLTGRNLLLANFGGAVFAPAREGRPSFAQTARPAETDVLENESIYESLDYQGRILLQEIDLDAGNAVLAEYEITSGVFKRNDADPQNLRRIDLYAFRAYRMALYPGD